MTEASRPIKNKYYAEKPHEKEKSGLKNLTFCRIPKKEGIWSILQLTNCTAEQNIKSLKHGRHIPPPRVPNQPTADCFLCCTVV
jgi:hypothetical protein